MRLLTSTLLFSVATLLATLLLFAQCCAGAGQDFTASSSGTSRPRRTGSFIPTYTLAEEYMDKRLKPIISYIRSLDRSFEWRLDPTVPVYERTIPLFPSDADPAVVAQALRDHDNVGIVNPSHSAVLIHLDNEGNLKQYPFEKEQEVLDTFNLHPNVHRVANAVWGKVEPPQLENVDGVPHFQGVPIISPNHHGAGKMYAASLQDQRAFWYPRSTRDPLWYPQFIPRQQQKYFLIEPWKKNLYREIDVNDERTKHINGIVDKFEDWKRDYGDGVAQLKWGRPLHFDQELLDAEPKRPDNIKLYHRFASDGTTRQEMINALKQHGRFRLYRNAPGQPDGRFRVRLVKEGSDTQGYRMDVVVEELTKNEQRQEKLLGVVLPAGIRHVLI